MNPRSSPNKLQGDMLFYQSGVFKNGLVDKQGINLENLTNFK